MLSGTASLAIPVSLGSRWRGPCGPWSWRLATGDETYGGSSANVTLSIRFAGQIRQFTDLDVNEGTE